MYYKNKVEAPGSISYVARDSDTLKTVPQLTGKKKVTESKEKKSSAYMNAYKIARNEGHEHRTADKVASKVEASEAARQEKVWRHAQLPSPLAAEHPSNWRRKSNVEEEK